ncbi:hypothetical protein [Sciscionella sediminilitoris]|uniref:hypothetical protein n=1 Tax=Sciscionella sediminilitoris TaxID=1445613 RepID=UPI0004DFBC08|nr:hypothetical protein [Sciscionella sp. SE31]
MTILFNVLLFAHFLGLAALIGAAFLQRRAAAGEGLSVAWLWASLTQLISGLAMVGLRDAHVVSTPLDTSGHIKIGVKLIVLLVIAVLAIVGRNRTERARGLALTMGGLTVLNIGIAVFWG